jgi:polyhydroxybutyrate depolymerase
MDTRQLSGLARCAAILILGFANAAAGQDEVYVDAGRGPVTVHVPPHYVESRPTALVLLLHGYGAGAVFEERYVKLTPLSDEQGFLLAFPEGLENPFGKPYWNGTDACCDYFRNTDDSGYLRTLVEEIVATLNVDPRRIFFFGHSNGGFMAHRVACDQADIVAAVASLGGANWLDESNCNPVEPINVLEIHGTADTNVHYDGGCKPFLACYPKATTTVEDWARLNHCSTASMLPEWLDLTLDVAGPDTVAFSYGGCDEGGSATLFTVVDGEHVPQLSPSFNDVVIEYLLNHPKPSTVSCADVAAFEASCDDGDDGTIVATLRLADGRHHNDTVDFRIDGAIVPARVVRMRAAAVLQDQAPGRHRVSLVAPAGCAEPVELSCTQ